MIKFMLVIVMILFSIICVIIAVALPFGFSSDYHFPRLRFISEADKPGLFACAINRWKIENERTSEKNVKLEKIFPQLFIRISSIILIFSGLLSFNCLYGEFIGLGLGLYSSLFKVTFISKSFEIFVYFFGALILVPLAFNLENKNKTDFTFPGPEGQENWKIEYSLIVLFTTLGASFLISSSNLVSMYLSIELQSFAVYILATIYRDSEASTSAGLKYFLIGGLSSCFILLGSGLIFALTGLINFESICSLLVCLPSNGLSFGACAQNTLSLSGETLGQGIYLGFLIIIGGFLFKIAAAPFYNWAPDVYDGVPTIVTTWLTIMPKISILIFILEVYFSLEFTALASFHNQFVFTQTMNENLCEFSNLFSSILVSTKIKYLLLLCSLLSLIIGTVVGLAQSKIKRLLGYSAISHVGFLLLALAMNTEQSLESFIFYLIQYSLTNINVFLLLLYYIFLFSGSSLVFQASSTENQTKKFEERQLEDRKFKKNKDGLISQSLRLSPSELRRNEDLGKYDIKYIIQLKGLFYQNPLLTLSLAICFFSMAGIPPLIGFFAKQQVLYSVNHSGYYFISLIAILVSVISAYYYLKIVKVMHFEKVFRFCSEAGKLKKKLTENQKEKLELTHASFLAKLKIREKRRHENLSNSHSLIVASLTLTILLFILKPSLILNSSYLLALSIFFF